MSRCRNFDDIRDVLLASIGDRVTIILSSGRILTVQVMAVDDDLLIASVRNRIISININRIDAVLSSCDELLASILNRRGSGSRGSSRSRSRSISGSTSRYLDDSNGSISGSLSRSRRSGSR